MKAPYDKMKFTLFGSSGFIGSSIKKYFVQNNIECICPDIRKTVIENQQLDNVIYAIGVTDFAKKPFETIDAHVCQLAKILHHNQFQSFLYLSSTRVYKNSPSTHEKNPILFQPYVNDELYNISKLSGETLCLSQNNPKIKIARLSNVSGNNFLSQLFLPTILRNIITKKRVVLSSNLESEKDYVHIDDVVAILPKILLEGKDQIYNVASGKNTSTKQILETISNYIDFEYSMAKHAKQYSFPVIDISKLKQEFNFQPANILDTIKQLVDDYRNYFKLR